jgi:hypothetical protein
VAAASQQLLKLLLAASGAAAAAVRQVGVAQLAQVQEQLSWHLQHLEPQQQPAVETAAEDATQSMTGQESQQLQQLQLQAVLVFTSSALLERCADAAAGIATAARAAVHAAGPALMCFVALHGACSTLHDASPPGAHPATAATGGASTKEPSQGPITAAPGADQLPSSMVIGVVHPLLGSLAKQAQQRGFTPAQLGTLFGLLFQVGGWSMAR